MKKFAIAVLALATIGATAAFAGPIEDRQATMKSYQASLRDLAPMGRGAVPYDAAKVKATMDQMAVSMDKFATQFPKGTEAGGAVKTAATPAVWSDAAGFKAAAAKFSADARATGAAADQAAYSAAMRTVQADCGACHKTYRASAN